MIRPRSLALAGGFLWGLIVFWQTLLSLWDGFIPTWLATIGAITGFSITPMGSVLALSYSFVYAYLFLYVLATLYNYFVSLEK